MMIGKKNEPKEEGKYELIQGWLIMEVIKSKGKDERKL